MYISAWDKLTDNIKSESFIALLSSYLHALNHYCGPYFWHLASRRSTIPSGQIYRIITGIININATHPAAWWRHPRSRVPGFRLAKLWCCHNSSYLSRRTAAKALEHAVLWIAFFFIDYLIDFMSCDGQKLFISKKYVNEFIYILYIWKKIH